MAIRRVKSGWVVDIQPGGRAGRRVRKIFSKIEDAHAWLSEKTGKEYQESAIAMGSKEESHVERIDASDYFDYTNTKYLSPESIQGLLKSLENQSSKDCYLIAKLCLATGAKWGEIEKIKKHQIENNELTLPPTTRVNERTIPLSPNLFNEITSLSKGKKNNQRLFKDSYREFRRVIQKSNTGIPEWQLTHILRHTFSAHFLINGGSLPALQKILGHKMISTTMRYLSILPNDVAEARLFNPLQMLREDDN